MMSFHVYDLLVGEYQVHVMIDCVESGCTLIFDTVTGCSSQPEHPGSTVKNHESIE